MAKYPGIIWSDGNNQDGTVINGDYMNERDDEIIAIETALGINLVSSAGPPLAERVQVAWNGSLQLAKEEGDVGIGTGAGNISGRLHVRKDDDGDAQLFVHNADTDTAARSVVRLGNSSTSGTLSYTGTGQSSPNVLRLANGSNGGIRLWTGNGDRVTVDFDGKVWIATTSPSAPLDVNGDTIRMRWSGSEPDSGDAGDIRLYNDGGTYKLYVHTGSGWKKATLT